MVSSEAGQLYTIEGLAAALIMIITAYMVVNATSVYTAGDTHISDMQLEAMGTDALAVMGTPLNSTEYAEGNSSLRSILEDGYSAAARNDTFRRTFLELVDTANTGPQRNFQFTSFYSCRDASTSTDKILSSSFSNSTRALTGTEHPVRVTKWIIVNNITNNPSFCGDSNVNRAILVEVLLWQD